MEQFDSHSIFLQALGHGNAHTQQWTVLFTAHIAVNVVYYWSTAALPAVDDVSRTPLAVVGTLRNVRL
jgi:hypothetical protein